MNVQLEHEGFSLTDQLIAVRPNALLHLIFEDKPIHRYDDVVPDLSREPRAAVVFLCKIKRQRLEERRSLICVGLELFVDAIKFLAYRTSVGIALFVAVATHDRISNPLATTFRFILFAVSNMVLNIGDKTSSGNVAD